MLSGLCKKIIQLVYALIEWASPAVLPGVIYKVIDINPDTLEAVIRSVNTFSNIKDVIPNLIRDDHILNGLDPLEACWLGYYYGKDIQNKSQAEVHHLTNAVNFLLKSKKGIFRIQALNREGILSYVDTHSNTVHQEFINNLAKNKALVKFFDPSQACYIGILAAMQGERSINFNKQRRPLLKLVE